MGNIDTSIGISLSIGSKHWHMHNTNIDATINKEAKTWYPVAMELRWHIEVLKYE